MADAFGVGKDNHASPRGQLRRFLSNFTKFTVDSAANVSFKGVNGGKRVYQIVQERLKPQSASSTLHDKKKCHDIESAKEMRANLEQTQEGVSSLKKQHGTSAKLVQGSSSEKKKPNEGIKVSDLPETPRKRVFIRSRL